MNVFENSLFENRKIHHKTLNVVYELSDPYDNLLLQSDTVFVHQRHLRFSMTEYIKAYHN